MSFTIRSYRDSDSEDGMGESASQPLLLEPSSSTSNEANCPTSTIKLPTLTNQNRTNSSSNNKINNFLANFKFNRNEHRRSHREKWSRINIGLITISFVSVVYLCFSVNLNFDKPSPQIIVDVPPIDTSLLGPKGKITFNIYPILAIKLMQCSTALRFVRRHFSEH